MTRDRTPSAHAASPTGPGDRCSLPQDDEDWWGPPLPVWLWRVTRSYEPRLEPHQRPAQYAFGQLEPGDLLRHDATFWYPQGCCNEPNVRDGFAVLSGELARHCVSTWAIWEPDRSMLDLDR